MAEAAATSLPARLHDMRQQQQQMRRHGKQLAQLQESGGNGAEVNKPVFGAPIKIADDTCSAQLETILGSHNEFATKLKQTTHATNAEFGKHFLGIIQPNDGRSNSNQPPTSGNANIATNRTLSAKEIVEKNWQKAKAASEQAAKDRGNLFANVQKQAAGKPNRPNQQQVPPKRSTDIFSEVFGKAHSLAGSRSSTPDPKIKSSDVTDANCNKLPTKSSNKACSEQLNINTKSAMQKSASNIQKLKPSGLFDKKDEGSSTVTLTAAGCSKIAEGMAMPPMVSPLSQPKRISPVPQSILHHMAPTKQTSKQHFTPKHGAPPPASHHTPPPMKPHPPPMKHHTSPPAKHETPPPAKHETPPPAKHETPPPAKHETPPPAKHHTPTMKHDTPPVKRHHRTPTKHDGTPPSKCRHLTPPPPLLKRRMESSATPPSKRELSPPKSGKREVATPKLELTKLVLPREAELSLKSGLDPSPLDVECVLQEMKYMTPALTAITTPTKSSFNPSLTVHLPITQPSCTMTTATVKTHSSSYGNQKGGIISSLMRQSCSDCRHSGFCAARCCI